jgi:predicted XRE-type DNA-binding protein
MRVALARRDIQAVFEHLQKYGVSQRRIAHFTRQTQSEISDIVLGRRGDRITIRARVG